MMVKLGFLLLAAPLMAGSALADGKKDTGPAGKPRRVEMAVTEKGFEPAKIEARVGEPLTLVVTRKTDRTCARQLVISGEGGKTDLPKDKTVEVAYTAKTEGPVKFGCAMGMMVSGIIDVRK